MHRNDKQNILKRAVLTAAISSLVCMVPMSAHAAGMGKITVLSALGQPLRAELEVTASREELSSLVARVAPVEAFRQANIEYAGVLSTVKFVLDKRPDGRPYFRIQTERVVNEPFIDFLVELSWSSGRLVREYAFLLDPADMAKPDSTAPAVAAPVTQVPADTVSGTRMESATEPALAKKSRKAPAPFFKPKVASDEPASAEGGNTRLVKSGDTLGKIAAESATDGVTLDQMLVALFNNNRDAFIGGNMNRLRAGKILNLPDAEKAAVVDAKEAHRIVVAQSADFNAYRNSLATAAAGQAAREQPQQQSSAGKITPKVEDKAAITADQDKLLVSRSEAKAIPGKGKLSEEDLIARDKALKEANTRIADLEKNLADLKKLAELKSQAATDAQKHGEAAMVVPAPVKPAEIQAPVPEKGITVAAPAPVTPTAAAPGAPAASSAAAPANEEKPQPKPKKKIVPPPPPSEPSFLEENPLLVYGGGTALTALLGLLGFRAWKRKRDAAAGQGITVSDLAANSVFGVAAQESSDIQAAAPTDFGHSTIEAVDTGKEGVDPIQEAEVYMAYGRDGQAEEILVDAMKKDPGNLAVYLKLLEIYVGRKTLSPFNDVALRLHERTGGSGSEWDKAAALGLALDPSNPLYGGAASEETASSDHMVELGATPSQALPNETDIASEEAPVLDEPPPEVSAAEEELPSALDFDLGLDATAVPAEAPVSAATKEASGEIDFDFDLGSDDVQPVAVDTAAAPLGGLDIDFDLPTEAGNSIDFDIAAPAAAAEAVGEMTDEKTAEATGEPALDFDFDLGDNTPALPEQPVPPLDLSSISLDLDEPAAPVAEAEGDSPEVATKLELAQAYEEMGDREGARELLEEVLAEGSPVQQEAARAKLAQLG